MTDNDHNAVHPVLGLFLGLMAVFIVASIPFVIAGDLTKTWIAITTFIQMIGMALLFGMTSWRRYTGNPGWFQIHLSTAIGLMFAAGGLMWANFIAYTWQVDALDLYNWAYGLPLPWYKWYEINTGKVEHASVLKYGILVNMIFAIVILTCLAVVCEYNIRRREGRKP